jgi:GST-like protein
MIDLYAMGSPNVVKIYIALEEMGLPYKVHPVDVFAEGQFSPEFLKLNPNAKVPVIVDGDGPGGKPYTVFESGAILQYLADKTGKLLAKDGAARYDALQWMMVQMTTIGPMWGQYVHFWRFAPKGNDYALDRYRTQVRKTLDVVEKRLGAAAYLGGGAYSIADIAAFPWLRNAGMFLGKGVEAEYPEDRGLGRRHRRAPGGGEGLGRGRRRARQDDPIRQGRRRAKGPVVRPRALYRGGVGLYFVPHWRLSLQTEPAVR